MALTNKEFVQRRFPEAFCTNEGTRALPEWKVYPVPFGPLPVREKGIGTTSTKAWENAACAMGRIIKQKVGAAR